MHRVSLSCLALLLAVAGAGCDGSSKASDRAAAAAPIVSSSATPAAPTVRFTGRVTHRGVPVEGAFLVLSSRSSGEAPDVAPASLFTDAAGAFVVDAPADAYDVLAVTTDGLVAEATLDLTGGPGAPLDLALSRVDVDPSAIGPGALQRLLSAGPLDADPSLLTEED